MEWLHNNMEALMELNPRECDSSLSNARWDMLIGYQPRNI